MSDMRLIVAGAGGRMGRTLVKAIADTNGVVLVGALDAASSAVIGRDAGELAGLGANGIRVEVDPAPLLAKADGLVDFTIPAATITFAGIAAMKNVTVTWAPVTGFPSGPVSFTRNVLLPFFGVGGFEE